MANKVVTYSPKDVSLIIGGYKCEGWDTISIARTVKAFKPIKGIRGKNTRDRDSDSSATISIGVLQVSTTNDVLSYIHDLDNTEGTARIALMLRDKSGRSVFSSNEGFITGYPTASFSSELAFWQWEIFCQRTDTYILGGNTRPVTSVFDTAVERITDLF